MSTAFPAIAQEGTGFNVNPEHDELLKVEQLHVAYGEVEAVQEVSLSMRRGQVLTVIGANGAGKTTTIGKLAKWLRDGEWEVVLGAADTFRAAAVDQLATWAERSGAGIVRPERDGRFGGRTGGRQRRRGFSR